PARRFSQAGAAGTQKRTAAMQVAAAGIIHVVRDCPDASVVPHALRRSGKSSRPEKISTDGKRITDRGSRIPAQPFPFLTGRSWLKSRRVSAILRPEGAAIRSDAESAVSLFQRQTPRS